MSAQHTPGPWWVTDSGIRDSGGYICHTNPVQRYEGQDERYALETAKRKADKRLIAASPELLSTAARAESFIAGFEDDDSQEGAKALLADLRAAIAKAGGAS